MKRFDPTLYLVTDSYLHKLPFFEALVKALQGGVTLVQLREKGLPREQYIKKAIKTKELCSKFNVPLIINDDPYVCKEADAAGVHIGKADLPLSETRQILGPEKIIGVSVHSVEEAVTAESGGANYVAVSPVFYTATKDDIESPLGLQGVAQIKSAVKVPVVAIGGINSENIESVIKAGADGVAVVSFIFNSPNPATAAQLLLKKIKNVRTG